MKTSRFTDSQIIAVLKQAETGSPVPELCREHGISNATFYKWRTKFDGMDASLMARMKELEEETRRLKKMYAEERLKAEIVAEALTKKWFLELNRPIPTQIGRARCQNKIVYAAVVATMRRLTWCASDCDVPASR